MHPQYYDNRGLSGMGLDESMRVYEDLVQQNLHLKQQIQRAKTQKYYSSTNLPSPSTAYRTNYQQSPVKYLPVSSQQHYYSPLPPTNTQLNYYQRNMQYDLKQQNEHYLDQLIDKNRYLQDKIDRLRGIHNKQHQDIDQIRRSRQWESRFDCKEDTCYEEKYMQLLRVRSPFY